MDQMYSRRVISEDGCCKFQYSSSINIFSYSVEKKKRNNLAVNPNIYIFFWKTILYQIILTIPLMKFQNNWNFKIRCRNPVKKNSQLHLLLTQSVYKNYRN